MICKPVVWDLYCIWIAAEKPNTTRAGLPVVLASGKGWVQRVSSNFARGRSHARNRAEILLFKPEIETQIIDDDNQNISTGLNLIRTTRLGKLFY